MGIGEIAGLIAAIAFAILVGFMIYPLIRLGRLFDKLAQTVVTAGDHAIPALDETVTTVKELNKTMSDVNKISGSVQYTASNVGALTDLYTSMLGKPVIKVASALYSLRETAKDFLGKRKGAQDSAAGKLQASESEADAVDSVDGDSSMNDSTDQEA